MIQSTTINPETNEMRAEKETPALRWRAERVVGPNPFDVSVEMRLQQRWRVKVFRGGYLIDAFDEWRDVPTVWED